MSQSAWLTLEPLNSSSNPAGGGAVGVTVGAGVGVGVGVGAWVGVGVAVGADVGAGVADDVGVGEGDGFFVGFAAVLGLITQPPRPAGMAVELCVGSAVGSDPPREEDEASDGLPQPASSATAAIRTNERVMDRDERTTRGSLSEGAAETPRFPIGEERRVGVSPCAIVRFAETIAMGQMT